MKVLHALLLLGLAVVVLVGCADGLSTPVPPTATPAPTLPTATIASPTVTIARATGTTVPPAATPVPPTATVAAEATATETEMVYVDDTPTTTPTISAAEAPTATLVAQLQATVEAGIRPTPTVDASGMGGYGGIEGVTIFPLKNAPGGDTLWVVHSKGSRSFDEPMQKHFVAIYAYEKGDWVERSKIEFEDADYLDETGVEQVEIEPTHAWLMVEGGAGAHSGVLDLLSFDGKTLKDEVTGFNTSPNAGSVEDLDGDGTLEVILNDSENYVFCYACGVRLMQFTVVRWDGTKFVEVKVKKLSSSDPAEAHTANDRAVDLYKHGLIKDSVSEIEKAVKLAPDDKTVKWNAIVMKLHSDARREHVDESGYPLIANVFYGDYGAALDIMRPFKPEEIFTTTSKLIVDTPAESDLDALTEWMTSTTTLALEAEPELAGAYYLRGWAQYLQDEASPSAISNIERAAMLDPNDKLFEESLAYLKKK